LLESELEWLHNIENHESTIRIADRVRFLYGQSDCNEAPDLNLYKLCRFACEHTASPFDVQARILELTENVKTCEEKNKELRGKLKGTEKKVRFHLGCLMIEGFR
jgi:hypothetical protein